MLRRSAKIATFTNADKWWPADQILIGPQFRNDFLRAVIWAVTTPPALVKKHSLDMDGEPIGSQVAIHAAVNAIHTPPQSETPIGWIQRIEQWIMRHDKRITTEMPPWPWGDGVNDTERDCILSMSLISIGMCWRDGQPRSAAEFYRRRAS